jgi:hypothetical protein
MNATMENLRNDVHKPPEQLEREADSARSALEGTLAELEHRLSPGEMLDRVMDVVKRHGGEFGDNLLTQVRNNPLPTILAGVGMTWLMTASKRPPPQGHWRSSESGRRYDGDEDIDATERWSSAAASARDAAASTADSAADSAKRAGESAFAATTDAVERAADTASRTAHRAADTTRHAAERVANASRTSVQGMTDGYAYLCREQPFVLGAIALAAGAALGALLPSTPTENSVLGATSDAAKSRLKSEAQARTARLRDVAADAVETVKETVASAERGENAGPQEDGRVP